jgi:hypothetical protein
LLTTTEDWPALTLAGHTLPGLSVTNAAVMPGWHLIAHGASKLVIARIANGFLLSSVDADPLHAASAACIRRWFLQSHLDLPAHEASHHEGHACRRPTYSR